LNKLIIILGLMIVLCSVGVLGIGTGDVVSYYKSDTNNSYSDAHASNDGDIINAVYTDNGKINGAYDFDGTDDFINITTSDFDLNTVSVSVWVNSDDLLDYDSTAVAREIYSNYQYGILAWDATNKRLQFRIRDSVGWKIAYATVNLNASTWYHIVGMGGLSQPPQLFVNNVAQVNGSATGVSYASGDWTPHIGVNVDEGDSEWVGLIDEVAIFNKSLDSTERSELYASGDGLQYPFSVDLTFSDWNMTSDGGNDVQPPR